MAQEIKAFGKLTETLTAIIYNSAGRTWSNPSGDYVAYDPAETTLVSFTPVPYDSAPTFEILQTADFPGGPAGRYICQLFVNGVYDSERELFWDGTKEVSVGTLTADFFAQLIEPGETLLQTLRLIRAVLYGVSDATDPNAGQVVFKRKDGTTIALTATYNAQGDRTAVTVGSV